MPLKRFLNSLVHCTTIYVYVVQFHSIQTNANRTATFFHWSHHHEAILAHVWQVSRDNSLIPKKDYMTQKTIKGKGYRNCKKGAMAESYYTACESKHLLFSYLGSCCLYSAALVKLFLQLWQFCKYTVHTLKIYFFCATQNHIYKNNIQEQFLGKHFSVIKCKFLKTSMSSILPWVSFISVKGNDLSLLSNVLVVFGGVCGGSAFWGHCEREKPSWQGIMWVTSHLWKPLCWGH